MKYQLLGNSGLRVSQIALGTLNFGSPKAWGVSSEVAHKLLDQYARHNGNFIDTAPNYSGGMAEQIVGEFIKGQRSNFVVGTKYTASETPGILAGGNSAQSLIKTVEGSLKRLQTDYIDFVWLHYWDSTTPTKEIVKAFNQLIQNGKVRYYGFSDTPAWLVSRAVTMARERGWHEPSAIQLEYNIASRDAENELLPMADALGLTTLAWGPLAAGALAGSQSSKRRSNEHIPDKIRCAVEKVQELTKTSKISPVQLALSWLLQSNFDIIPLIGARTEDQLKTALQATSVVVDEGTKNAIDQIAPSDPGFPYKLINSKYLRQLAFGQQYESFIKPRSPRA